jgi:transposase-like protein
MARRRRWSAEQKRAMVAESLAPGAVVTENCEPIFVRAKSYRWRRAIKVGSGFVKVPIAPLGVWTVHDAGCAALGS